MPLKTVPGLFFFFFLTDGRKCYHWTEIVLLSCYSLAFSKDQDSRTEGAWWFPVVECGSHLNLFKNQVAWKLAGPDLWTALYLSLPSEASEKFSFTLKGVPIQADVSLPSNVISCHFSHVPVNKSSVSIVFYSAHKSNLPTAYWFWLMRGWFSGTMTELTRAPQIWPFRLPRRLNTVVGGCHASTRNAGFEANLGYIVKERREKGREGG